MIRAQNSLLCVRCILNDGDFDTDSGASNDWFGWGKAGRRFVEDTL